MRLSHRRNKKKIFVVAVVLIIICFAGCVILSIKANAPNKHVTKTKRTDKPAKQVSSFDRLRYSTVDPSSPWIVVNKPNPLNPIDFNPSDLVSFYGHRISAKSAKQLQQMIADSKSQGINLRVISGFRSYSYQTNLYNSYVSSDGQAQADTYSARPGHSEHQTGLAVDIGGVNGCDLQQCFASKPEGHWIAANSQKYGFLIRYTQSNQVITGYQAEPWHLRYVGIDLVNEMAKQKITTLEEFFDISGGSNY